MTRTTDYGAVFVTNKRLVGFASLLGDFSSIVLGIHEHVHRHDSEPEHAHPHHHVAQDSLPTPGAADVAGAAHGHTHGSFFERYTYVLSPIHALDPRANEVHGRGLGGRITRSTSPMAAVIPTNEEFMIARDTAEIAARDASIGEGWDTAGPVRATR